MKSTMQRTLRRTAIVLACAWLAGCASVPYHAPAMPLPAAYQEAQDSAAQGAQPDTIAPDWWHAYGDATLDALLARIDVSNQSLLKSMALLRDARAQVDAARAAYFPTVGATASVTSTHLSANVVGHSLAGKTTPDHLLGIGASWEPDLFGRIGNNVDAAQARAQASADDVAAVRLSLQAEAAIDYFGIRSLDREAALLQQTVDAYASVLQLVTNRYRGGIAAEGDVAQAQAQLESTRAQVADLRLARTQLQHALATLVGEPASTFALPVAATNTAGTAGTGIALPATPAAVPAMLLQRRPDISAAERRVAAANAQIGVARAAFFPTLMLNLNGGLESSGLAGWLTAPSRFWAVGPALAATIFDGGKRQAGVDSARAQFDASAADYRETVLKAVQDVEDNYAALRLLDHEAASQQAAVTASSRALQQATERYRKGAAAYLDVNVVQAAALTDARALEAVHRRQLTASVSLFRALGGGWEEKDAKEGKAGKAPNEG
ncbi:efflux transporter outer membrane subunit [Cupriavidus sp. D384]|uniref:efflux transporter outer membrane subunit n=1 Tax=Cupriavidus sp. D384 TaxID=1538095 RepID=UPI00082EB353|nr:efflux transporter outer membrane subunit [Cupriavidus sp. D384]